MEEAGEVSHFSASTLSGTITVTDAHQGAFTFAGNPYQIIGASGDGNYLVFSDAANPQFHSYPQSYVLSNLGSVPPDPLPFSSHNTYDVPQSTLCFCRGTYITTTRGDIAVEALQIGDLVLTARGQAREIRWLGATTTLISVGNRPVIIRRGSLGHATPVRDLRVTEGHSFLFGDVLIPIGNLVNGRTILWDEGIRVVEVYHVELAVHDVLYADGALAESYRDDGNRVAFNPGTNTGYKPRTMPTCSPIVTKGPLVEKTRRHLDRIASTLLGEANLVEEVKVA